MSAIQAIAEVTPTVETPATTPAAHEPRLDPTEIRRQRGLAIAAICLIRKANGTDWKYLVPSQKGKGFHTVSSNPEKGEDWECSCKDFELRRLPCKHIFAVGFVIEREKGAGTNPEIESEPSDPVTPADRPEKAKETVAKRPTVKRPWKAINEASTNEKTKFLGMLNELCRSIPEPPKPEGPDKGGQRRLSLANMTFAVVFKVYSTISGRRFTCDLEYARERGYIDKVPHFNSLYNYLEPEFMTPILTDLIVRSSLPLRIVEEDFTIDSSGFSSSKFVRWFDQKYGVVKREHDWVKAHVAAGVKTHVVTAAVVGEQYSSDSLQFVPLLKKTAENFSIKELSADGAYCTREAFSAVDELGAKAYIAFRTNSTGGVGGVYQQMFHYFSLHRDEYLDHYHKRSNAESVFSMIKAKFGDPVRSRSETAMRNEVLCKIACHNICRVIQATYELGINPVFWDDEPEPTVLGPESAIQDEAATVWDWV